MKRIIAACFIAGFIFLVARCDKAKPVKPANAGAGNPNASPVYNAPDTSKIPHDEFGAMVRYGRKLIVNTAYYIGPNGIVSKNLGNKMNCQSCHLDAGTRPYGINFLSSHARYPQYRGREDRILTLAERVNNCIERPHNGKALPLDSKEMVAMVSYIKWLGQNVPTDGHVEGDGGIEITMLNRAASPEKGKLVYIRDCQRCHGAAGEGQMNLDNTSYLYPPVWGLNSYQPGSSMHRLMKAAKFIKANMPFDKATWQKPYLSDEDAIDVAAYINDDRIHARPSNNGTNNYPSLLNKPLDFGQGPYLDTFSDLQHKFGPYQPIIEYWKSKKQEYKF
jgi:thiosulfate dehydrogenase